MWQYAGISSVVRLRSELIPTVSVKIRRESSVIEFLLLLLGGFVFAGISWTAWDIRTELRRQKLK